MLKVAFKCEFSINSHTHFEFPLFLHKGEEKDLTLAYQMIIVRMGLLIIDIIWEILL